MPWLETYEMPLPLSSDVILGSRLAYDCAKRLRRRAAIEKEDKSYPKEFQREWAKRFKGYDYVVKYYEGNPEYINWRTPRANPELAPFIDSAFREIEYSYLEGDVNG